jgi:hypothetical protein
MFGAWKHVVCTMLPILLTACLLTVKLNLPAALANVILTIQMQAEPHLVIYQIQMFLNSLSEVFNNI